MEMAPARMMTSEQTIDRIGRRMKTSVSMVGRLGDLGDWATGRFGERAMTPALRQTYRPGPA